MMNDELEAGRARQIHHSAFIIHHFLYPSVAAVVATAGLPLGTSTSRTWRRCFLRLKSRERQLSAARKRAATAIPPQPKPTPTPFPAPVRSTRAERPDAPLTGSMGLKPLQPSSAGTVKMVS